MSYTELGYTPGWCGQCGRRLGRDRRCSNCDPWWTSPVMHYVGGLAVLVTFVVLGIIAFSRPQFSAFSASSSVAGSTSVSNADDGGALSAAPSSFAVADPAPSATIQASAPMLPVAVFSASGGAVHGSSPYSEDEIRFNELVQLRQMTAYVDSVVGQRAAERSAGLRSGGARRVSRAMVTLGEEEGK